jgi:hypothetical protein
MYSSAESGGAGRGEAPVGGATASGIDHCDISFWTNAYKQ